MTARFRTPFTAIEPGDVLRADDGFTCMGEGDLVMVQADEAGDLYVACDDGRHMLDGQCDGDGMCVGFRRWG